MLIAVNGDCPKCGKPYPKGLTAQGATFHCEKCDSKYMLCPTCKSSTNRCPKCGGNLLDEWEYTQKVFGNRIIF